MMDAGTARGAGSAANPANAPWMLRLPLAVVACASVFPLLAWVYELGSFAAWGAVVGAPLLLVLVAFATWLARSGRWPGTRAAIVAGALGGLVGTLGYDFFRVPFIYLGGYRLLAPIESYGVLLLDAGTSSPLTDFSGWAYHFANGIGFGIAYALVAAGRSWRWAILWGLFLESAVVFSPFARTYGLVTDDQIKWIPITIAYAAHVPYGIAVGLFAQRSEAATAEAVRALRAPVAVTVLAVLVVLAVWHRPLLPDDAIDRGNAVAAGPSTVILGGEFHPSWLRVPLEGCATIENGDAAAVTLTGGAILESGARLEVCGGDAVEVRRVRVDEGEFSGGWLIVDPADWPRAAGPRGPRGSARGGVFARAGPAAGEAADPEWWRRTRHHSARWVSRSSRSPAGRRR